MLARDILADAGRLIADQARWCQGALARDKRGTPVAPASARAVRWDAIGAIYHVVDTNPHEHRLWRELRPADKAFVQLEMASNSMHRRGSVHVNDVIGHAAILDCMRRAWAAMREERSDE